MFVEKIKFHVQIRKKNTYFGDVMPQIIRRTSILIFQPTSEALPRLCGCLHHFPISSKTPKQKRSLHTTASLPQTFWGRLQVWSGSAAPTPARAGQVRGGAGQNLAPALGQPPAQRGPWLYLQHRGSPQRSGAATARAGAWTMEMPTHEAGA